jgi:hypothetical protein
MIVLAYLGPLALVPLVAARGDLEVQWHARQGLLLAASEALVLGALSAVTGLTALSSLAGGIALGVVTWIAWLSVLAIQLAAMLTALNGGRLTLPIVSPLATRLGRRTETMQA